MVSLSKEKAFSTGLDTWTYYHFIYPEKQFFYRGYVLLKELADTVTPSDTGVAKKEVFRSTHELCYCRRARVNGEEV